MSTSWNGYYLDGRCATRHRATVRAGERALEILTEGGLTLTWPYTDLIQTQGNYEGEAIRFEWGREPSEAVVFSNPSILREIQRVAPQTSSHFHDPSMRRARSRWTAGAAIAVILLSYTLYQWGIPFFSALITPAVPVSWEEALGEQVVRHIIPDARRCRDPRRLQALSAVANILAETESPRRYTIRLYVLDDPSINAFAAPGGHVVLLRGLLERTDSPEQLAGVLAHELQHIYKRHTTRAILEQTAGSLLIAAISGDFSGGLTWGLDGVRVVSALRYSRAHEAEADLAGFRTIEAAGLDSTAMIAFFRTMQQERKHPASPLDFLSTHPDMDQRIATLSAVARPAATHPRRLLPDEDWTDIRSLCRIQTSDQ